MFTLYRTVKRTVSESVPDRASVHTWNAAFEAVSAPERYCSTSLFKVERSVSGRFFETVRVKSEHFYWSRNCNGTSFWSVLKLSICFKISYDQKCETCDNLGL